MAPPNDPANAIHTAPKLIKYDTVFDLVDGKLSVHNVPLLSEVPATVTFRSFSSVVKSSTAPPELFDRAKSLSHNGGFFGFSQRTPSDRLTTPIGKFTDRDFLSIFRFKTWWSTQWVGTSGSNIQSETQWIMLDLPEIRSYALVIPIIDGCFRSSLQPGVDGHMLLSVESGSSAVKAAALAPSRTSTCRTIPNTEE